jgi:hypothetical protein
MREMSVSEQRYKAVLAGLGDGRTAPEVARDCWSCPECLVPLREWEESTAKRCRKSVGKSGVYITIIPVGRSLQQALPAVRDCAFDSPVLRLKTKEVRPRLITAVP